MVLNDAKTLLRLIAPLSLVACLSAIVPQARASTNLLGGYFGASYGHAKLDASDTNLLASTGGPSLGRFDLSDSAYQITAGIRGLEFLGAEVDYFDLGSGRAAPSLSSLDYNLTSAHLAQKGEAAFAVFYLPVPIIDLYVKAGVARLTTDLSASTSGPLCPPGAICPVPPVPGPPPSGSSDTTNTGLAAGAGVQWKLGDWAVRGEYERFSALGEHPSLISIGMMWSFL